MKYIKVQIIENYEDDLTGKECIRTEELLFRSIEDISTFCLNDTVDEYLERTTHEM